MHSQTGLTGIFEARMMVSKKKTTEKLWARILKLGQARILLEVSLLRPTDQRSDRSDHTNDAPVFIQDEVISRDKYICVSH